MSDSPYLLLDCYLDDVGCARHFTPLAEGVESIVQRPAHEPVRPDLDGVRGLVVTGSAASVVDAHARPWIADVAARIREAVERRLPVLGVCFGHQLVAETLFGAGSVRLSPTPELGWFDIEVGAEHPLFAGVPSSFRTFLSHFDEVVPERPGMRVLARSERCAVQAFDVPGQRVWCVQFHAEMDDEETERLVRQRSVDRPDLGLDPERVLAGRADSAALKRTLFENFVRSA